MASKNANGPAKSEKTTAGLRGAAWNPARMQGRDAARAVVLPTQDKAASMAFLFAKGGEKTAVMLQHPREFIVGHYMIPELLDAGVAVLTQAPRSIGNDLRLEHEQSLYEVAAGVRFLREQGFERIVLLGNSGGASLYCYYNEQSLLAAEKRLERSPTGKPTKFAEADMPAVDGIVLISPHPGQGLLLMNAIDPSVTDEHDAHAFDPALYPFSPFNGFRRAPEGATYEAAFIERYRAAQKERVARIDKWAFEVIKVRQAARAALKERKSPDLLMAMAHTPIRTVWRTDADLRCWDTSLDPSDRKVGSLWGPNPLVSNYGSVGFGRQVTAESWLSTWSGLKSMAAIPRTAPAIEQPTLLIAYRADNSLFPSETKALFAGIGSSDKTSLDFMGDHHGRIAESRAGQEDAGAAVREWLGDKGFL